MRHIVVQLEFVTDDDDIDPDIFGEHVLCAIEQTGKFATEDDGMLRLIGEQS